MLREEPSGNLFALSQNAAMGWDPAELGRPDVLILSTQGGLRDAGGRPVALGYHTGHWEVGQLVEAAARELRSLGVTPFAGACTTRSGVIGVATCDKGLPAMMMALAGARHLPCVLVPGGVSLMPDEGEDAGRVQAVGARFAHDLITLEQAALELCRSCATPGGGCQFLGTAATSQVVAEASGLALTHSALAPSGQPIWSDMARRSAQALVEQRRRHLAVSDVVTPAAIRNAMTVHAAFGGSTNLVLHVPALAHAAGVPRPTVDEWVAINRRVPRLVDAMPNGPIGHSTARVFMAGGVPEVMLHLRDADLLDLDALTASGDRLGAALAAWERSERRRAVRRSLWERDGVDPDTVIMSPAAAAARGLTSTVCFPRGNLAPGGSVIKCTAIDGRVVDPDGVYRKTGPARVFVSERAAVAAIKEGRIRAGDVLVLAGRGPMGSGMEETYQITAALRHLPFGRDVAVITDARFSGVSTGACVGHVTPEGLAGGPIGRLVDGDVIRIVVDRVNLDGSVDLAGTAGGPLGPEEAARALADRRPRPDLAPDPDLPAETRVWAALQQLSGGTWGGCVYDAEAILGAIEAARPG
ncbi:MAG: YjhG/YagF family D-xylonate dehydratase [Chloroflexi bacterium]|nr:MAG: YjhG/YagF family D-xylonate dehydratase [Chloroflexota bacterium]